MKHIICACLFVLLLSSCGQETTLENSDNTANEIVSETGTAALDSTWENWAETLSGELNQEDLAEEAAEESTEQWENQEWAETPTEVVDASISEDLSEDTSGGQFIFKTDAGSEIKIYPIDHATAVVEWDDITLYADPSSPIEWFESADFVFVSHEHADHFNTEALDSVLTDDTFFVTTQTVFEKLPEELKEKTTVMNNGDTLEEWGFTITALPAYNIREDALNFHPKGQGNGYIFEKDGFRVYFSWDSEDTPEMRALENIDIAFVSMNLPFTMSVESAANAVLEFAPTKVFPYHYRGQDWLSDIDTFKAAVEAWNPEIEVLFWDWYWDE